MSIRTRLRYWLARRLFKAAGLTIVPEWVRHSVLEPSFRTLTEEGYRRNAAFFACVSALAFAFPEPPLAAWREDERGLERLPQHPLRKLLRRPNPLMGEDELWAYVIVYAAIGGNAYLHIVRDRTGNPLQLWPYHAGQISPVPGGPGWIERYDYDPGDGRLVPVPASDVIHFKWPAPDPRQPWMAQPPLLAAAAEVDSDNEASRYLYALLRNDAVPRTVVTMPAERYLEDTEYERFKREWRERYGGSKRGDVAIVEGGATVSRLSLNLEELAFEALHRIPETRIAAALRVPPIVAGLSVGLERSTFANYAEARRAFTQETLVPLWRLLAAEVESSLGRAWGDDVIVQHDLSAVVSLQEDENRKWERIDRGVRGGYLTINEARRALGYEDLENGDVLLWSTAILPQAPSQIGALTAEAPQPAAEPAPSEEEEAGAAEAPPAKARKSATSAARVARSLQRTRRRVAGRMERAVDAYFRELAERVIERARKRWPVAAETKELPEPDDLLTSEDDEALETIVRRYALEAVEASWDTWNEALDLELAFDVQDPAVRAALAQAGTRVRDINATTLDAIRALLQHGADAGWSIDQLVEGDEEHPGLRALVQETYRNRARNIARTEIGTAQNVATHRRYAEAGVERVLILDNGQDDPDEPCRAVNGTTQTLDWFERNPLQHPQCTRAAAPVFGEE